METRKHILVKMLTLLLYFIIQGVISYEAAAAISPHGGSKEVSIPNGPGKPLSGTLYRADNSKFAIVFAHSYVPGQDKTGFRSLALELAEMGITSLTFDFPGIGKTEGPPVYDKVDMDVRSAIAYLHDLGYSNIASMGVGLGGLGSATNARELVGLITISIPTSAMGTLFVTDEDLSVSYPKLFIAAKEDFGNNRPFAQYALSLYELSVEPKELKIFSGAYHSMALFDSEHKNELHDLIIDFFGSLNEQY